MRSKSAVSRRYGGVPVDTWNKFTFLVDDENVAVGKESARMHVNTEIIKENQNLRKELKELTKITETWLNSSNKVNLSGQKDLIFVKSSADDTKVSILGVERPWLSEAEGFILPNHDTGIILLAESQVNTTDPLIAVNDSSTTEYDSVDESSVCSTPLPPLEKLAGAEPVSGPKTIKLILKSNSTFKAEALKGVTINEPSPAPAKAKASASKTNSALAGKLKNVKTEDDLPLTSCKRTDHRTCDHTEYMSTINMSQHLKSQGGSSSRSRTPKPLKHFFSPFIHYGFNDHLSDDCVNYPICDICGSYDHDIHGHNRVISQRRGEAIQAKKPKAHKSNKTESSNASRSKTPTKRHMTSAKSYLHKYVEQPGPNVVFRDDSTCNTKGYGSIKFYIHNHKDNLGKFDEKDDDGYFLGYLLVSKAFRVFNTRIQQTEETYHITFDESTDAIKFTKPSLNNIYIAESERYPPDE
ncbi:hypothetical protein Tco_1402691 [Tanacetum coccineum]